MTYTATAKRWAEGWELHIEGVGVTQSRRLGRAQATAREYISMVTGTPMESVDVTIIPQIGDGLDKEIREAREAVSRADEVQRDAAKRSREVATRLKAKGLSGVEIAAVLRVSPQRVSQLTGTAAGKGTGGSRGGRPAAHADPRGTGKTPRSLRDATRTSTKAGATRAGKFVAKAIKPSATTKKR